MRELPSGSHQLLREVGGQLVCGEGRSEGWGLHRTAKWGQDGESVKDEERWGQRASLIP